MVMAQSAPPAAALRAFTYRLSSTPAKQLPKVASQIAGSLWNCKEILSASTQAKQSSETSAVVHKFKTHLSTLLQDRSIESRWSAVVLVKSTIEAGGVDVLAQSNTWVRSLLGILKKPDPPTTRCLAVLTLTRIFMLTWAYSNLVREITTPALTAFVPTCLTNIENARCSTQELQAILDAFGTLLPKHPTIFRAHETKLRAVLNTILSAASSETNAFGKHFSKCHETSARRLLVLLHSCAAKQGASERWQETVRATVLAAHATCDRIFRAVHEHWTSNAGVQPSIAQHVVVRGDAELEGEDLAGLQPWKGVFAGAERLKSLLGLLECHLATTTPGSVTFRLGLVADLSNRIFAVVVSASEKADTMKYNSQISKDERDALFAVLPDIHISGLQLTSRTIDRFGAAAIPYMQETLDHVIRIFQSERTHTALRMASYSVLEKIISITGPVMLRHETAEFEQILRYCCEDVFTSVGVNSTAPVANHSRDINQQLGLDAKGVVQTHPTDQSELVEAGSQLLCTTLQRLDSRAILPSLRTQIDRIIVLTRSKDALVASVMNPPTKESDRLPQASLLPILAREFGHVTEVEALLRPRMPVISATTRMSEADHDEELEDEDSLEEELLAVEDEEVEALMVETRTSEMREDDGPTETPIPMELLDNAIENGHGKRKALDGIGSAEPLKRARASPLLDDTPFDSVTIPVEEGTVASKADTTPVIPVDGSPRSGVMGGAKLEDEPMILDGASTLDPHGTVLAVSDDSDFEMPPLTMEPDTDEEEE